MEQQQYLEALQREGALISALPPGALDNPVSSCPGWPLQRLVGHVGRVHRWAAAFLAAGPDSAEQVSAGPRPPQGAAVLDWYQESLGVLVAELARHEEGAPARSFLGPGTARFWFRRQAHEAAVHRWDAQDAVAPGFAEPVDSVLAADGIDEWLEVFVPRFLARVDVPAELHGASVHLHCTDSGLAPGSGEWLLRVDPAGPQVVRAHAKGDAALRGPASDLLLAVWHRLPLGAVDVVGDSERAAKVIDLVHVT
jgi:uncharacterized protein (TIGR03083 family)